jgi:DNA-binding MarR family transcriptional regulator
MGYIHYKKSETDGRSVRVSLTQKGHDVCTVVNKLYQRQLGSLETVGSVDNDDLKCLNKALMRLERFWSHQILYRL